jgi:PhzF family phenazine biosynthesis protein
MQKIAMENCVAETAFFIPHGPGFHIRWFTPEFEIDLCGHATLATAHVLIRHLNHKNPKIKFQSKSGELFVTAEGDLLTLDFPSRMPFPVEAPQIILDGIKEKPLEVLKSRDYFLVYEDEEQIRRIQPDVGLLNQINIDPGGIIVTAPGRDVDFVSRFFTPQASVFEDPVTGSAHCSLIPYWAQKLQNDTLTALQISPRVGKLFCKQAGDRVLISGKAITYLEGLIRIE